MTRPNLKLAQTSHTNAEETRKTVRPKNKEARRSV